MVTKLAPFAMAQAWAESQLPEGVSAYRFPLMGFLTHSPTCG